MPIKFNYDEMRRRNPKVAHAFVMAIENVPKEFFASVSDGVEIELRINGFEVSFEDIIGRLMAEYDAIVESVAKMMFDEKAEQLFANLEAVVAKMKGDLTDQANKLFPKA